jgi:hypothetical protein
MATEFELMKKAKELHLTGKPNAEIVTEVHHDELWVAKSLEIMNLPKEILEWYEKGKVSRSAIEQLCSLPPDKAKKVFKKCVEIYEINNKE